MLALTALSLIPRFLLGFLVIDLAWRDPTRSRVLELFMAGPLGVGISSLLSFLWIWMRLDLRLYATMETVSILLCFAFWAWKKRSSIWRAGQSLRHLWPLRGPGWWVGLFAAALMFSAQFWTISLQQPHGSWDAWATWNAVSRFVYRGGERWQDTFLRISSQPDYPLLIPMTNATTWEVMQTETTRGPMVLSFLFAASLVGLLFGLVRQLRGSSQACLVAIAMLTLPLLVSEGVSQYADVPEACYFLASAGMTVLYLRSRERSLAVLAGLTAGLGAWTKNEGSVFAATSLVAWAYLSWRERSWPILSFVLGAAVPLTVLGLFKGFLAPGAPVFSNIPATLTAMTDPARYLVVFGEVGNAFWSQTGGAAVQLLILGVYACLMGRTRQSLAGLPYLIFMFATQAAMYLLVYVGTPFNYGTAAMVPTSIGRLYMHILPLLLGALFLWLRSPDDLDLPAGV